MPTTLVEFRESEVTAADAALTAAEALVASTGAALKAARAAVTDAVAALDAEVTRGAAIRAELAETTAPADAVALAAELFDHEALRRAADRAVVLARVALAEARAAEVRAQATARRAEAAATRAAAALADAETRAATWSAWADEATAIGAVLGADLPALQAGDLADALARVEAELPAELRAAAINRRDAELDRLDGADPGLEGALTDAEDALDAHRATGGLDDIAAGLVTAFERAAAALQAAGPGASSAWARVQASLTSILAAEPLSAEVVADIAAKTPAGAPTPAELDALEAAVPDSAWRRFHAYLKASEAVTALAAHDAATTIADFDAARQALATGLDDAATFDADRAALALTVEEAREAASAAASQRDALLLSALRGDA